MQQVIGFSLPTNGTPTSDAAAASMRPHAATLRADIYSFVSRRHQVGATADEIEMMLEIAGNTVRPRLVELRQLGSIRDSGRTRKTRSGRSAIIWVAA